MKYKSTLARGLSHAWPWTKPIGSSPTASRLLRYSLLCMLVLLCGGSAWAQDVTATLTGADLMASTSPSTSYADYTTNGMTDDQGNTYYGRWLYQKANNVYYPMVQIKKVESSNTTRIQLPKYSGNIKTITLSVTDANSTAYNTGTGAKTQLAIINSTTYTSTIAKDAANQVLVVGSSSTASKTYEFDFTQLETSYDGEGLYICSLDAAARIWSIVVVYDDPRTTTNITLTDGYAITGTEGKTVDLPTATVMAGENTVTGATVTWTSSDENVAKIEDNKISLLTPGTATITASYAGNDTYKPSKATYDLTVTELSVEGLASMAIIFKETGTSSDGSSKVSSIDDIISEGSDYVSAIPTATNVYNGRNGRGLKLGAGSSAAELKLTLAEAVKPIKITFDAMQYSAGEASITVNGKTITNLGSELATYSVIYDGETEVSSIEISTPSKRAYITNVKIYYEPEATPAPLYILGDMANWDRTNPTAMAWDSENEVYTYTFTSTAAATYFCFADGTQTAEEAAADNEWTTFNSTYRIAYNEGGYDAPTNSETPIQLAKVNSGDATIILPAGQWTISVSADMKMTITGEATPVTPTEAKYYVVGNMTAWDVDKAYEMTRNEGADIDEYSFTMDLTTESQFKVVKVEEGKENVWYPEGMGNSYGENGEIFADGNYTIYFRPNADGGEDWFYHVIYVAANETAEVTYVVAGSEAEIFGTSWDGTNEANKMTKQTDGTYQKTYTVNQAYNNVQLKVVKDNDKWYGDAYDKNIIFNLTGAGNFTVTINPETNVVSVTGDIVQFPTTFEYEKVVAAGNGEGAWLNGANWDPGYQDNQMTEVSDGVWEISFENVPEGYTREIKFAIDGAWSHNFGGTFSEFGVATDAVYNGDGIKFDTENDLQNIKVQLDLRNFDFTTKEGAKFTITSEPVEEPAEFRDIKVTLNDADMWQNKINSSGAASTVYITVDAEGNIGTTENADEAAATLKGYWHGAQYGWQKFSAEVPVEGCVKITLGASNYGTGAVIVTNSNGDQVAKIDNHTGAMWSTSNPDNVAVGYYRTNEPTTLTFSVCDYIPYFAVEAIDEADLPAEVTNYNITFAAGEGVEGVAPAAVEVEAGNKITAPKNTSLYKEGYTLIGWESGNAVILPGEEFTPEADMELTAKFGVNEVSLADREDAVTVTWQLGQSNGVEGLHFEGNTGFVVTQATVNGKTIDVQLPIDATSGKFFNKRGDKWAQVNANTTATVPACKGATISVNLNSDPTNLLQFGESTTFTVNSKTATFEVADDVTSVIVKELANDYWSDLSVTLPKVESTEPGGDDVSGVFFSANVIATDVQNFATGTTEITSAQATIVGGKMYAISAQEAEKALINKQGSVYYFSMTNNNTYFKVELDHALAVGDVITADANGGVKNNLNKGLWVSTSDGYPTTAPACAGTSETESIITNLLNYTIQEGDEYVGKKTLYIYRAAGATEYFGNLKITRPASDEPSETNLKEKAIIDTDFQDWAKSSETTMVTTKYTKENITFTYSNATVDPEATNEGKFPTTTDAAYKGYIMSAKSEATITTTTFASISKIRYRHGATGNNRGWGLKMKVGDGDWETVSDATVGSTPAWIEKTIDKENVQLQWYNLNATQNAYMFELEVYAKVDLSNSPLLATLKANSTTYTAEDIFEMGTDDNYAATIELASSEAMPSAENPVEAVADNGEIGNITYETSNDQSVVTIPVTAGEASVNYVATFVRKPNFTLTYYNVSGEEIGTQTVEKDAKIGKFAYDIADVAATKDDYKARGWFKNNYVGEKWTTESVITADAKLYAVETEIEVSSDSKKYVFDLTDKNFDAADHEAFNPTGNGKWHDNQHGWAFANGDKLDLLVGGKASIIMSLCAYSADGIKITASNGESVDAKVATDGATATIEYEGEPGTLTLNFNGTTYLHKLTIFNTTTTNYEVNGDWIIVKEGDASSLVDALFAAKEGTKIFLPNGMYDLGQKTLTTIGNNKVSIIGESMEGVIIKNRPTTEGIAVTATLLNTSTGLYMQDLTLDCVAPWSGSAERGVTLQDMGNQTILKNVYLKGLQDTYYSNNQNGTYYFEDGKIEGSVDYVCGNGDVYFNKTLFYTVNKSTGGKGGCIAAPNTTTTDKKFGYIFNKCTLDGVANEDGQYRLGRPWAADTKCLFVNTTMKIKPVAEGWGDWSPANPVKQFAEYNSKDAEENVISLDGRKNLFNGVDNNPVLTEAEAEALAPDVIFNGEWKPQVIALQIEAPVAELKGGVITWEKVDGATAYALFNNGSLMAIVSGETTSYTVENGDSGQGAPSLRRAEDNTTPYTLRAANGRGGFGEPKIISMATGIKGINAELNGDVKIYDMQGRQVKTATKGVYIINGKKVVIK